MSKDKNGGREHKILAYYIPYYNYNFLTKKPRHSVSGESDMRDCLLHIKDLVWVNGYIVYFYIIDWS